jgi:hypothetical protein
VPVARGAADAATRMAMRGTVLPHSSPLVAAGLGHWHSTKLELCRRVLPFLSTGTLACDSESGPRSRGNVQTRSALRTQRGLSDSKLSGSGVGAVACRWHLQPASLGELPPQGQGALSARPPGCRGPGPRAEPAARGEKPGLTTEAGPVPARGCWAPRRQVQLEIEPRPGRAARASESPLAPWPPPRPPPTHGSDSDTRTSHFPRSSQYTTRLSVAGFSAAPRRRALLTWNAEPRLGRVYPRQAT